MLSDKQGYQQSYDAALVGADRSKDIVVLRLLNLQVRPPSPAMTAFAASTCWGACYADSHVKGVSPTKVHICDLLF